MAILYVDISLSVSVNTLFAEWILPGKPLKLETNTKLTSHDYSDNCKNILFGKILF